MKKDKAARIYLKILGGLFFLCIAVIVLVNIFFCPPWIKVPEIGRNLPANFSAAKIIFQKRVESLFPIGSREKDIIEELEKQGFKVNLQTKSALYKKPCLVCEKIWKIYWETDRNKNILSISAIPNAICL